MSFLLAAFAVCLLWHTCWLPARLAAAPWLRAFTPLERLCLSFLCGALGLYVVWFAGVIADVAPATRVALVGLAWGLASAWSLLARLRRSDLPLLPERDEIRWAFRTMAIPVWMLALAWTQSTLFGGGWSGDWNEHYRRTLFFLGRLPPGEPLEFGVTDRPPLFNLVAAAWSSVAGSRFSDYQIVHLTLSCFAAIPCLLLLERLAGRSCAGPRGFALFFLLYVLQPATAANTVYTWTRMLAAFFVLSALYFYLRHRSDERAEPPVWSALAGGLAIVTHYSAILPVGLIGVDWVWRLSRRRRRRRGRHRLRAFPTAAGVALLAPVGLWIFWAVRGFGWRATLSSNTTAENYAHAGLGVLAQWRYNFLTTVVPFWDLSAVRPYFAQVSRMGEWSDRLHFYWVSTLAGSVSTALIVACLLAALLRLGAAPERFRADEARALLVGCWALFFLTFPTIPNREIAGIAHLALQPMDLVLLVALAAWLVARGGAAERLFLVLYGAEGGLFYWLKTFDRSALSVDQLGFGYAVNRRIQEAHHLALLFDRDPAAAPWARGALLAAIVVLIVWCVARRPEAPA